MRWFGKESQDGQAILLMAMGMVMLIGIAGLAIDGSNLYLIRRQAQNAADFAAFGAGKQLAAAPVVLTAPPSSGDASIHAAHDFATLNGVSTVYSTSCDQASASSFTATWFDSGGFACSATSGFRTKIQVNVPVLSVGGLPVPTDCTAAFQYSCFQVTVTERVDTVFGRTVGVNQFYFTVSAIVKTIPANNGGNYLVPQDKIGVYLYQPQAGCAPASQQCFDETKAVARATLSCTGTNNCPTFWVNQNTAPSFWGTDGATTNPVVGDTTALQSNGDMVIQDKTVICDPYNGGSCNGSNAVGAKGFALAAGSKLYCGPGNGFVGGGSANGYTGCTSSGQSNLNKVAANETAPTSVTHWRPSVDTSALPACGALVLNGDTVANSFTLAGAPACVDAYEPYLIMPGKYTYIVINHGTYSFDPGLYDLTGVAPVNTATGGSYHANGIDHSQEQSGVSKDFDLCTGGQPNSCPTLTAAVWIGHGGGWSGAYSNGTQNGGCTGGTLGTDSGGGDDTIVQGSGVSFRFEASAGGFVSTHEVLGIALAAPGVGGMTEVAGTPLLFDLENGSFIHLDSAEDPNSISQFVGLIYQLDPFYSPSAAGGGVEFNPALAAQGAAAIDGPIWAYSLTTFGASGPGVDFTDGFGGSSQPLVQSSGKAENSIVSSTTLTQAVDGSGNPVTGFETLTIQYTDEWALDAYDLYVKVNNAQPAFFGKGIWNPIPPAGAPLPPFLNNPGDANDAYPAASPPSGYTGSTNTANRTADWIYTTGSGATLNTWEVSGNWTWGHEKVINGSKKGNDLATIKYTFPTPAGQSVAVTIFLTDGDKCGDYYLVQVTMNNVGQPFGGTQSVGSVVLVR